MKDYRKNMRLALVCFLLVVVLNFFPEGLSCLPGGEHAMSVLERQLVRRPGP